MHNTCMFVSPIESKHKAMPWLHLYCYNTCQLYKLGIESSDTIDLVSSDTEPV